MPTHLFIYGTLHPATLRGTLYDLGDYPGVIIHPTQYFLFVIP